MRNLIVIVPLLLLFINSCNKKEPDQQPNIIYIMTDDHGYQAMSCYDGSLNNTPNLDRIAEQGVIFLNSFVSNSICAPSRAVMLTGKHSHLNGQINNGVSFDGTQQTFPKLLQSAGYQTAMIGKWHLRSDPTGFDYWNILPGQGSYYNPDFIEMGEKKRIEGYVTEITTDIALNWLENGRNKEKPFCLLLHHKAPHRTWQPDTAYLEEFLDREFPVPENFFDDYKGRIAARDQKLSVRTEDMDLVYDLKMNDAEGKIQTRFNRRMDHTGRMNEQQKTEWDKHYNIIIDEYLSSDLDEKEFLLWKYQRYMQDYLACVQSVDDNVGRLLDYLKESGMESNTVIIYTSDQGFYLGEHGWFDKRFMYEESMRTPLVMSLPERFRAKGEIEKLVQNIDFAPSILDLAGVEIPADMQGRSILPLLMDKNSEWRDQLYYHYYEYPNEHAVKRHYGVRTENYKLIHFYYDIDVWELYDLQNDPKEMNNIYDHPDYNELRENMHVRLDEIRAELAVPEDDQTEEIKK